MSPEDRATIVAKITQLRILATDGITQMTINGKTVRYASPMEMLKVADQLEATIGGVAGVRTGLKSSRMVYRRG